MRGCPLVILAALLLPSGCSDESADTSKDTVESQAPQAAPQTPTDFPLTPAAELANEFLEDEKAAVEKYRQKTLLIEGTVVEKSDRPAEAIVLEGHKDRGEVINIECVITLPVPDRLQKFKSIKIGDRVTVRGLLLFPEVERKPGRPGILSVKSCKIEKNG